MVFSSFYGSPSHKHIYQIIIIFGLNSLMAKITARSVSSAILSSILLSAGLAGIALNYIGSINNAYAQNNWYLGKGVQANTYYTYKIQDHDTEQGQPFIMSIYFKQFNSTWKLLDCSNRCRISRQGI